MNRKLLCFAFCFLLAPLAAVAQTTGTLEGKVVDEDGKPVIGATISIVGTEMGTYSKAPDGRFILAGVRAGSYEVKITVVGKDPVTERVVIGIGQTTTLNVKMGEQVLQGGTVIITGKKEVKPEQAGTINSISSEDYERNPRGTSIVGAVALTSGVTTGGVNGVSIRGGRSTDTKIQVDGVDIGDQFTGGFGSTSASYYPQVSTLAIEQTQVISSGFAPEYGDILSGVVNSVTRSGRNDRYEGSFRFRTGLPFLYGSSSPITVKKAGTTQDTTLPGAQSQSSGSMLYEMGFGGPIPGTDKVTFFLSGRLQTIPHAGASYEVYDLDADYARQRSAIAQEVWGMSLEPTNLGQLPHSESLVRNASAKVKANIAEGISLEVGGEIGLTSRELGGWSQLYMFDHPTFIDSSGGNVTTRVEESVLESDAQQVDENTIINRLNARYFQQLTDASFFEVNASYVTNEYQIGKKDESKEYGILDTYDIYGFEDADDDKAIDYYESEPAFTFFNQYTEQQSQTFLRNPITGLYEGPEVGGASRNPYGLNDLNFPVHGNDRSFDNRESQTITVKGIYENNFNLGEVKSQVRTGFEVSTYTLKRHQNSLPWDVNPFFDVYGFETTYFQDDTTGMLKEFFAEPFTPLKGAFHVGTRFDYKTIVFQPGVRFDFLSPNAQIAPTNRNDLQRIVSALDTMPDASVKFQVSPRIGVTYPVTESSQFRVNFAMMFKMPDFNLLYDKAYGDALRANQIFGNPDIDPQKVVNYEVGYTAQFLDNYYIDVSAYYRDIYNQTGVTYVPAIPTPYSIYSVQEYGNVRGFQINARRNVVDHIGAGINYTLQRAVGTASSPLSNYSAVVTAGPDPFTGELRSFPLTEFPLDYDQTHSLNANLQFSWGDGEGPTIGGLKLLENTDITFQAIFASGLPYTLENQRGEPISEFNALRLPNQFTTEAHIERAFRLADIFGESVGDLEISAFADIFNLLNQTDPVSIRFSRFVGGSRFSITGSPDNDGSALDRRLGDFTATPYYKDIDPARPETYSIAQYDRFGDRLYNPYADSNLDGIVTQLEKYEGYQRFVSTIQTLRNTYQTPLSVVVGVRVRF